MLGAVDLHWKVQAGEVHCFMRLLLLKAGCTLLAVIIFCAGMVVSSLVSGLDPNRQSSSNLMNVVAIAVAAISGVAAYRSGKRMIQA